MSKNSPRWLGPFTDVPSKGTPVAADLILIGDSAAGGARKYTELARLSSARSGGSLYISTPVATLSVGATPVKAAGTTTALRTDNFTHATGRLTYVGTVPKTFQATAAISAKSSIGNVVLSMYFAKNGTVVAASEITRKIGTANDVGAAALVCTAACIQNDYIEIFISVTGASPNITLDQMILSVIEA